LVQADLLSLVPAHLARHGVADLDRYQLLHNLGDVLAFLLGDIATDLLADGVTLLRVLVAGDLPVLADLLWNLPLYSVLDIVALLPWHIPAAVLVNSIALLFRVRHTRSLWNLSTLLFWNIPADINMDNITFLLGDRVALSPGNSLALLTRHWPAVIHQDRAALLLHPGCAGSVGNISTLEGWLILVFLSDITAALFSDGGAIFVCYILAVLLGILGADFIHNSFTFSFLDSVADLCGDVLAIILSLFFTDLSRCCLTLVHVCCSANFFRHSLALLFWDLGAFPVIDSVADLAGHDVHHGPLLSATVLNGVHHRHLDSLADDLGHTGALLVVHSVTLGPGHSFMLSLVLYLAHLVFWSSGLAHGNSLIMTDGLQHSVALSLVVGVALLGWDRGLLRVVALLDHGVGTDVLGDGVAFGSVANVGAMEDVNQEKKGDDEDLHLRLQRIQD